jgi:hypothetical protein
MTMKKILVGIIPLIILVTCIGCTHANDINESKYGSGHKDVLVGDIFSSTLVYAGYLPQDNIIVFGDWFNHWYNNLFIRVDSNGSASFIAYNDLYELSNISIDKNSIKCDAIITGK